MLVEILIDSRYIPCSSLDWDYVTDWNENSKCERKGNNKDVKY